MTKKNCGQGLSAFEQTEISRRAVEFLAEGTALLMNPMASLDDLLSEITVNQAYFCGTRELDEGNYALARRYAENALLFRPDDSRLLTMLAASHSQAAADSKGEESLGHVLKVEAILKKVVAMGSNDYQVYSTLLHAHFMLGLYYGENKDERGVKHFVEANSLLDDMQSKFKGESQLGYIRYQKACISSLMGKTKEAYKFLQQAIRIDGDYAQHAAADCAFRNIRDRQFFKQLVG